MPASSHSPLDRVRRRRSPISDANGTVSASKPALRSSTSSRRTTPSASRARRATSGAARARRASRRRALRRRRWWRYVDVGNPITAEAPARRMRRSAESVAAARTLRRGKVVEGAAATKLNVAPNCTTSDSLSTVASNPARTPARPCALPPAARRPTPSTQRALGGANRRTPMFRVWTPYGQALDTTTQPDTPSMRKKWSPVRFCAAGPREERFAVKPPAGERNHALPESPTTATYRIAPPNRCRPRRARRRSEPHRRPEQVAVTNPAAIPVPRRRTVTRQTAVRSTNRPRLVLDDLQRVRAVDAAAATGGSASGAQSDRPGGPAAPRRPPDPAA